MHFNIDSFVIKYMTHMFVQPQFVLLCLQSYERQKSVPSFILVDRVSVVLVVYVCLTSFFYCISALLCPCSSRTRLEALTFINKVLCRKIVLQHLIGMYVLHNIYLSLVATSLLHACSANCLLLSGVPPNSQPVASQQSAFKLSSSSGLICWFWDGHKKGHCWFLYGGPASDLGYVGHSKNTRSLPLLFTDRARQNALLTSAKFTNGRVSPTSKETVIDTLVRGLKKCKPMCPLFDSHTVFQHSCLSSYPVKTGYEFRVQFQFNVLQSGGYTVTQILQWVQIKGASSFYFNLHQEGQIVSVLKNADFRG